MTPEPHPQLKRVELSSLLSPGHSSGLGPYDKYVARHCLSSFLSLSITEYTVILWLSMFTFLLFCHEISRLESKVTQARIEVHHSLYSGCCQGHIINIAMSTFVIFILKSLHIEILCSDPYYIIVVSPNFLVKASVVTITTLKSGENCGKYFTTFL